MAISHRSQLLRSGAGFLLGVFLSSVADAKRTRGLCPPPALKDGANRSPRTRLRMGVEVAVFYRYETATRPGMRGGSLTGSRRRQGAFAILWLALSLYVVKICFNPAPEQNRTPPPSVTQPCRPVRGRFGEPGL